MPVIVKVFSDVGARIAKKEIFENMIIMKDSLGFIDWSRAAITDWILDFATLDFRRFGKISNSFVFTRKTAKFRKFNQKCRDKTFSKTKK